MSSDSEMSEVERAQGNYRCTYGTCKEYFRREKNLDMHLYKHTGEKKHKCDIPYCDKGFILAEHLKRHIQTVHGFADEEKSTSAIKCDNPDCPKTYQSHYSMKKHYKQAHLLPKTHDCPQCQLKFNQKRQLRLHLYTHTGDYPQKCALCPAGFVNLKELRSHHTAKHKDGGKKRCPVCCLYFANWTAMVAHRKATHPSTFPCPTCGREFYSRCKLKIHCVTHQEKTDLLECGQEGCGFKTANRTTLIGHIRRNHGDKSFKCDQCEKKFARHSFLSKHQRVMHSAATKITPVVTERRVRKDQGMPKRSTATKLTGIPLDLDMEKVLLADQGRRLRVNVNYSPSSCALAEAASTSATDTESEASTLRQGSYAF